MAGWVQAPGGQAVYHDNEVVTHDGEVVTFDDAGGWLAFQTAKTASVGAWSQDASWEATLSEDLEGAAGWAQVASWDAAGLHAEAVSAQAAFDQSATWDSLATHADSEVVPTPPVGTSSRRAVLRPRVIQSVSGSGSFAQPSASWLAFMDADLSPVEEDELLLVGAF